MFVRNGNVVGSVLNSAVPAAEAEKPKPPAKKAAPAPARRPVAEKASPITKKEVSASGNDTETR